VHPLLPAASSSFVLVTSRIRLDGLVARTGARLLSLGTLAADAAERLIEHMAGTPAHSRDREQRRRLARLCGHLPLALRIVAARLAANPQWTVADLVEELADERSRLAALDTEDADTSVRAALDVTYRSLRPELAETVRYLGLYPGTRIGPHPVAALSGGDVDECRRVLRALAASFVVTETSRDVFLMHDLVRLHASERAGAELSEVDTVAAVRRLRRYYLAGARTARALLRPDGEPLSDGVGPPMTTADEAVDWIDKEWANLLAVVESGADGTDEDDELVALARLAAEFSEGTRALGPAALSRLVRLVV
jgi:hypothetical protein